MRRAVIDIGTNSVKLLVAEVEGRTVSPLLETSHQTRLGAGFYADHMLKPERIRDTAGAVRDYCVAARQQGAEDLCVIATSAARDARNRDELLSAIDSTAGIKVRVLTGEEEAHWAFCGGTSDPKYGDLPTALMEVGGGSTQFIAGHGQHVQFLKSFDLGTVRLLEHFPHSDPPTATEYDVCAGHVERFLKEQVEPEVARAISHLRRRGAVTFLGAGGTASVLGCLELALDHFDREALESVRLSADLLRGWETRLWSLPLHQRRALPGLPPKRADVILMGIVIYRAVCQALNIAELRITTRGLRFGAVQNMQRS